MSDITVEVKVLPPYKVLHNPPKGTKVFVIIGGRGGGKTYEVSKYIAKEATIEERRCLILRDEKEQVRDSILNEVLLRYDTADEDGILSQVYERLDTGIKDRRNGNMVVFTKGFRASSGAKTANLKGVSDVDIAVIEEAEDIRDKTKFDKFSDSIRKKNAVIIIILNTPDINHWIIKRYFRLEEAYGIDGEILDGYFKIIPKTIPGFQCINTSYKDNPYLDPDKVREYESYADPSSERYDLHHYYTDILGYASSGRKGQVFKKVKPISLKEYLALPYREYYGQDFGTTSPAGMVGIKKHRQSIYIRQMNYRPKHTLELGMMYCDIGLHHTKDKIIADIAGKDDIQKLSEGYDRSELEDDILKRYPGLIRGWDIQGWPKRKVQSGVRLLNSMNIFVTDDSEGFWDPEKGEIVNYVYAQDKNGNYLDEPIDDFNHLWDPTRYVAEYLEGESGGGMERTN